MLTAGIARSLKASALPDHNRYQQELQGESQASTQQAPMDAYERIAQKALADGLTQEQTNQVLSHDPFHQTLPLGLGQPEADRYNHHLLNSLGSQGKTDECVSALENRIQSLSSQLDTLNQKLDRLGQSKALRRNHRSSINSWEMSAQRSLIPGRELRMPYFRKWGSFSLIGQCLSQGFNPVVWERH